MRLSDLETEFDWKENLSKPIPPWFEFAVCTIGISLLALVCYLVYGTLAT